MVNTATHSFDHIASSFQEQKAFFQTGATIDVAYRIKHLNALRDEVIKRSEDISAALYKDLGKSHEEAYLTETGVVLGDLNKTIKKLPSWVKPRKVKTPWAYKPATSQVRPEPYGNTLVIGPWNFPFALLMQPMIGAIAAGNTVMGKPSEHAPHTAKICKEIIEAVFDVEHVACVEGGIPETTAILKENWDYIFFTGSTHVGKIVYKAAAEHLTPVTLELGGKSPCIIDKTANLKTAALRIAQAKYLNVGQICISPDYLLVEESVKDELVEGIKAAIQRFYGDNAQKSPDYGRIINERNFDRLVSLLDEKKVIFGGDMDRADKYISPTIMDNVAKDDKIMKEEIFGPILPVFTWKNLDEVKQFVNEGDKPLVLYMFSKNKANVENVLKHCSSGGVNVNDCFLQNANKHLPFGGVGASGIGAYNGQFTFDTFSHLKGEVHKNAGFDSDARYPPLKPNFKTLKWVLEKLT